MRNRRFGSLFMTGGILLVVAAIGVVFYNLWDNYRAQSELDGVLDEIIAVRDSEDSDSDELLPDYMLNPQKEMPAKEIDGYMYIGTLEVPLLDLELPVMQEWSYPRLKIAPCRYTGSVYLNNMIIAAHNYDSHFGRLKNLQAGDEIIFTDMDGNVFSYAVAEIKTLEKTAVEEMQAGEWDLTLFTCTLGGQTRVTVRCIAN